MKRQLMLARSRVHEDCLRLSTIYEHSVVISQGVVAELSHCCSRSQLNYCINDFHERSWGFGVLGFWGFGFRV